MAVNNRVKITNDIELKDRLVAINRVTKVQRVVEHSASLQLSLLETKTVLLVGALVKQVK